MEISKEDNLEKVGLFLRNLNFNDFAVILNNDTIDIKGPLNSPIKTTIKDIRKDNEKNKNSLTLLMKNINILFIENNFFKGTFTCFIFNIEENTTENFMVSGLNKIFDICDKYLSENSEQYKKFINLHKL